MTFACADASAPGELEALRSEVGVLRAEALATRETAETLEKELRSLREENARLADEAERLALEPAAAQAKPCEEVTRIIEVPRAQPSDPAVSSALPSRVTNGRGLEVLAATARTGEQNSSWWRFGWTVELRNVSEVDQVTRLELQFMDREGYVLDTTTEPNVRVAARSTRTLTGATLVDVQVAPRVVSVRPVFRQ